MKISVVDDYLNVAFTGFNDEHTFTITTPDGHSCIVNGEPVDTVSFTIVGDAELQNFCKAVRQISRIALDD